MYVTRTRSGFTPHRGNGCLKDFAALKSRTLVIRDFYIRVTNKPFVHLGSGLVRIGKFGVRHIKLIKQVPDPARQSKLDNYLNLGCPFSLCHPC
jgi:hypothetical protein